MLKNLEMTWKKKYHVFFTLELGALSTKVLGSGPWWCFPPTSVALNPPVPIWSLQLSKVAVDSAWIAGHRGFWPREVGFSGPSNTIDIEVENTCTKYHFPNVLFLCHWLHMTMQSSVVSNSKLWVTTTNLPFLIPPTEHQHIRGSLL